VLSSGAAVFYALPTATSDGTTPAAPSLVKIVFPNGNVLAGSNITGSTGQPGFTFPGATTVLTYRVTSGGGIAECEIRVAVVSVSLW
jgi:hypothetical protein